MDATMMSALMSSAKSEYETPLELFAVLDSIFNFELDVCATAENSKCFKFITPEQDAFTVDWDRPFWLNPPYGRKVGKWIDRAQVFGTQKGGLGVVLVAARTETMWFQTIWRHASMILFLYGRLTFVGCEEVAPFPSVIASFGTLPSITDEQLVELSKIGNVFLDRSGGGRGFEFVAYSGPIGRKKKKPPKKDIGHGNRCGENEGGPK